MKTFHWRLQVPYQSAFRGGVFDGLFALIVAIIVAERGLALEVFELPRRCVAWPPGGVAAARIRADLLAPQTWNRATVRWSCPANFESSAALVRACSLPSAICLAAWSTPAIS